MVFPTPQNTLPVRCISFYQEDLQFMAAADLFYGKEEHGFSLFGLLTPGGNLVCYVALSGGPNSIRSYASFQDDPEFIMRAARFLLDNYNLIYIGNVHSHPMNLTHPSPDDQQQILNVSAKNGFSILAQIIITYEESSGYTVNAAHKSDVPYQKFMPKKIKTTFQKNCRPVRQNLNVRLNSYIYPDASNKKYQPAKIKILDGKNPFRQQLSKTDLAEYVQMDENNLFPMEKIFIDPYQVRPPYDQPKIPQILSDKFKNLPDQIIENFTVEIVKPFLVAKYDLGKDQSLILVYKLQPDYSIRKVVIKNSDSEADLTDFIEQSALNDDVRSIYDFVTKLLKIKEMLQANPLTTAAAPAL